MTTQAVPVFDYRTESLDGALEGQITLIQAKVGYRYSVDAVLLAHFAPPLKETETLLDVGTGCGVIPLILLHQKRIAKAVGIELQPELAELARRNARMNDWAAHFDVMTADLKQILEHIPAQSMHLMTANPPFYPVGSGKACPNPQEALARQELAANMRDILVCAKRALISSGRLCVVYPAERLFEFFTVLAEERMSATRMRLVHGKPGQAAKLVLVEAQPRPGNTSLVVEAPLILENGDGRPTSDAKSILTGEWDE